MEEVSAHVHPGPVVPDVLSRQHEHRFGLIWSGQHKTCFTDPQCRRFGRNLFHYYSIAHRRLAVVHNRFGRCTTDRGSLSLSTYLGLVAYTCIAALADYGCSTRPSCSSCQLPTHTLVTYRDQLNFMPSDQIVEYHYPGRVMHQFARAEYIPDACDTRLDLHRIQLRGNDHTNWGKQHASHYIRWYRGITQVCISNPANHDTLSHGYQPTFILQEVNDMASVVIQEPPTDPSQMTVFAKKVQMIIRRCMVSIGVHVPCTTIASHPREHVTDRGARRVKRSTRRQPSRGVGGGHPLVLPFPNRHEHVDPGHMSPPPVFGFAPFQSPHSTSFGFYGFRVPPPSGTAGSSTPHQPISQASSSDEEERTDDMDVVQHYRFGHRVGKKTTRFTPSDWP
ncbi:hypothetical protein M9H77_27644 [Catharanthus roseus]|uniref:Uncharacterized protein n=1 Tax=Catharanthus roseus TaxID=4058 RepID=A0ACC0AE39_CATRO|nr:hypothetical protein M9H77_27644 [Catharanthus roseus]